MFGPTSPFFYAVQNQMGPLFGSTSTQVIPGYNGRGGGYVQSWNSQPQWVTDLNSAFESGANRQAGLTSQVQPYRIMGDTQRYMADTQRQIADSTNQLRAQTLQNVLPALMGPLSAALAGFGQAAGGIAQGGQQPGPRDVRLSQGGPGAIGQLLQALMQRGQQPQGSYSLGG